MNKSWIDSLKGIAICCVILNHCGGSELPSILGRIGNAGKHGVQLFLLLSVYLSFESLERYFQKTEMSINNIANWLKRKYLALVPLYYLSLIIHIFLGGSPYWLGSEKSISTLNLIFHIFFLHGFAPLYANSIIGLEWYLGVLAIFYLAAPFLYKFIKSITDSIIAFVFSLLIPCFFILLTNNFLPEIDEEIYRAYIFSSSIYAQLPIIMLGIFLYYFIDKWLVRYIIEK